MGRAPAMMGYRSMARVFREVIAVAAAAAALTAGLVYAPMRARAPSADLLRGGARVKLAGKDVAFILHLARGRVTLQSPDGAQRQDVSLELVVDGTVVPVPASQARYQLSGQELRASFAVPFEADALDLALTFRVLPASNALSIEVAAGAAKQTHGRVLALRVGLPSQRRGAFVSGIGPLADAARVSGRALVLSGDALTLGVASSEGLVHVSTELDEGEEPVGAPPVRVTSPEVTTSEDEPVRTELTVALAPTQRALWGTLFGIAKVQTARVFGTVTGTRERTRVVGLDADGTPLVRVTTDSQGRFSVEAPKDAVEWFAAVDVARASEPVRYTPGTRTPLALDVSPGGELRVRVIDADSSERLTARLLVHGLDGTLDPNFGPDFRASGAGPIIDALRGEVVTPLPVGRYRVAATKGIEWSIDAAEITVRSGHAVDLELRPRHVVPTPTVVSCDLHVHARPSFDTPVSPEDRVLSLVSAGIDFAVPSEHNVVGDYGPATTALDVSSEFTWVHGMEVTTFGPGNLGHFGVFPYPKEAPLLHLLSLAQLFTQAKKGDPTRVLQVNHPRLSKTIGYFTLMGFSPRTGHVPARMRTDFDTLEVYNGYDLAFPERVEQVMDDWYALLNAGYRIVATGSSDSHRIQYQWAGYPRTLVDLGGAADRPNPLHVVAALKRGHATVTSGPVLEVDAEGARPGDELVTDDDRVLVHALVRAAPWIDVAQVEVVVDGELARAAPVPLRRMRTGPEPGTLQEASDRTIRFDETLRIPLPPSARWLHVVARGRRKLDEILPFMPIEPLAFTNPIYIVRRQ